MNIKSLETRLKKLEQGQQEIVLSKLYWWDHDESEQEFLSRNSFKKIDLSRDDVLILSWQR